ncbi:MAG TPA: GNAT family N-acetyltransferase [Rhodanobacter sp.]
MATDIQVRTCAPGDESALALIGQATFLETFAGVLAGRDIISHCIKAHSVELYRGWLASADRRLWLAEVSPGSAPIGFMATGPAELPLPDASMKDLEIKRIYILGKFQGGGLGKELVMEAVADARARKAERLLLGVYAHNDAAIGFYARMGFRKLGTRKFSVGGRYYDDIIMGLSL